MGASKASVLYIYIDNNKKKKKNDSGRVDQVKMIKILFLFFFFSFLRNKIQSLYFLTEMVEVYYTKEKIKQKKDNKKPGPGALQNVGRPRER